MGQLVLLQQYNYSGKEFSMMKMKKVKVVIIYCSGVPAGQLFSASICILISLLNEEIYEIILILMSF